MILAQYRCKGHIMASTSIEWTDATWNPVAGCTIASAGCTNCYAMRMAARLDAMGIQKYSGLTRQSGGRAKWNGKITLDYAAIDIPSRWKKPRRVFVNSMSDLFQEGVPTDFVAQVWDVMRLNQRHTFQILTKRPDRMATLLSSNDFTVLPNVWLGTSVEDGRVLTRIDELRDTPAAVRFISFEPLIGSVGEASLRGIHWVIVGGESGPGARPMDPIWVDEIHELCSDASVPFFFKQWGGPNKKASGRAYRDRLWDQTPGLSM